MMENNIYTQLKKAQANQELVDIYQKDSDIVYTGRVKFLANDGFIMLTYNDFGIDDGAVYLKNENVTLVDFDSFDVQEMIKKISFARLNNLYGYNFYPHQTFDENEELFGQLFDYLKDNFLLVMVITKNGDQYNYHEGMLMENNGDQIVLQSISKFDFTKQSLMPIQLKDMVGIEYAGNELSRLGKLLKNLSIKNHIEEDSYFDKAEIKEQVLAVNNTDKLITLKFKGDRKYFYVGQVIAANQAEFVIKVISINGTFGGYVWMRYDMVAKLTTESDYLKVVSLFVDLNQKEDLFSIDILNSERAFDSLDNVLLHIVNQAKKSHELLKFTTTLGEEIIGYPAKFDEKTWELTIDLFEYDELNETPIRVVTLESIGEISFDYLRLAYIEKEL